MDWKDVGPVLDQAEGHTRFKKRLFSRIVPTVRDIGLWSDRVQKAYTDLGGIQYAKTDAQEMLDNDATVAEEFDRKMKEGFGGVEAREKPDKDRDRHHPAHHHLAAGDGDGARIHRRRPQLADQPRAGAVPRVGGRVDRRRLLQIAYPRHFFGTSNGGTACSRSPRRRPSSSPTNGSCACAARRPRRA